MNGYVAHGITATGERVPLTVTAETGATGLVIPSVHLDGQAFDRVVVDVLPFPLLRHEGFHGSDGGLPDGAWETVTGPGLDVESLLDAPLDAVQVEPIRVGPGYVVDPDEPVSDEDVGAAMAALAQVQWAKHPESRTVTMLAPDEMRAVLRADRLRRTAGGD